MKTFFRQWQRKACGGDEKHQRRKAHEYLKDELGNGKKAAQTRQYTQLRQDHAETWPPGLKAQECAQPVQAQQAKINALKQTECQEFTFKRPGTRRNAFRLSGQEIGYNKK